ncbi:MAG: Por secretion system C-terminal sorting protein, partial [Bacteroidetes bacterium]|nr:Por secretion system C-terminal sorting protein [Bacteroidota bacterium]
TLDDSTVSTTSRSIGPLSLAASYYWRVRAKNLGGWSAYCSPRQFSTIRTTSVEQLNDGIPTVYSLSQNYPNPFNPTTIIQFALPKGSQVLLKVFDLLGREITTLVSQELGPGYFVVRWQANVPSGTYIYRLQAEEFVETRKMILLH